jgi:hypothetical protein
MRAIQVIHVEDMITAKMRQRYPDIEGIGIRHGAQGWDILRDYEIVQR